MANFTLNNTGIEIDRIHAHAYETVADITARDAIDTSGSKVSVGKQVLVLSGVTGKRESYEWNGLTWDAVKLDFVDFDTSETIIPAEGRIGWDSDASTLTIGLANGVVLQVGQEQYIRAKNVSGSTITNGQAVYISGASGNRPEVNKAIASQDLSTKTIAVCTEESIGANQNGFFTTIGIVNDIDTSTIGVNPQEGDALYLSATTAGVITNVKPAKPNYCVCIGYIVRVSATVGTILVKVGYVPKLGDLSDVDTSGLVDGDQIYYDDATNTWKRIESGFNALTLWDDIILSPESLGTGASAPDLIPINGSNLRMYGFNGVNTLEQLWGSFELVHTFSEVSEFLRPHIHWCPTTTNTGNVKWQMEYEIHNMGQVFTGTTTTISAIDSADGVAYQNLVVEFGTIPSSTLTIGAQCKFRIFRNPLDAQDTYPDDAGLLTIGVHFEANSLGSRQITIK